MNALQKTAWSALVVGSLWACNRSTPVPNQSSAAARIQPPIAGLDVAFTVFEVETDKDQIFKLPNGGSLFVPAGCFVDTAGKPLNGKVQLRFREMHDAVDILLSGIPMDIETAGGKRRQMQTAGMFELRAEQNGKSPRLKPGTSIRVRLASWEAGTDYNVFFFDENKGWEFVDYSPVEANPDRQASKVKAPDLPFPLGKEYFCFSYMGLMDVLFNDDYSQVLQNKDNPVHGEKARKYGLSWLNAQGHQLIDYQGSKMPSSFFVWKRLSGKDFPEWLRDPKQNSGFDLTAVKGNVYTLRAQSQDEKQSYTTQIQLVMPLKNLFKFSPDYWEKNYEAGMAKVREEEERLRSQALAFRSFEAEGFGIYNYDKLLKESDAVVVRADFRVEQQGNELYEMDFVFYLPQDNKTLVKLPKSDWGQVALLPDNGARFLTILPGGAIGLYAAQAYRQLDFEALRRQGDKAEQRFDLVRKADKVGSADELRRLLNG